MILACLPQAQVPETTAAILPELWSPVRLHQIPAALGIKIHQLVRGGRELREFNVADLHGQLEKALAFPIHAHQSCETPDVFWRKTMACWKLNVNATRVTRRRHFLLRLNVTDHRNTAPVEVFGMPRR